LVCGALLAVPEPTLLTKVVGVAGMTHALDNFSAACRTLDSGQPQPTYLEQGVSAGLQYFDVPKDVADATASNTNVAVGLLIAGGSALAVSSRSRSLAAVRSGVAEPVAPATGARLSQAQQAVFDEVSAIPGIDCERAMLEFQRRLPEGRRVSFGGRCDHHVWVHEDKVLDPTASQYLRRWPQHLLDREPGLEQAIRSGVFTPEQHATFMSRVSGEEITAASYLKGPR
jgi:hypothetical protein